MESVQSEQYTAYHYVTSHRYTRFLRGGRLVSWPLVWVKVAVVGRQRDDREAVRTVKVPF